MKILITGASGYIGTILREIFENDEVTLLSRKSILPNKNERWIVSGNLQNDGWWSLLPTDSRYDAVFHLAEAVRKNGTNKFTQQIIEQHVKFINHVIPKSTIVIYPLTAYLYDSNLSSSNKIYAEIKRGVYGQLFNNSKVSFPVIHPVCDSGPGLSKIIQIEKRIPLINILCAFGSTMPILRIEHLKKIFSDPISSTPGRFDMFSEILPICELFKNDKRANAHLISKAVFFALMALSFVPSAGLLVKGRRVDFSGLR